MVTGYEADFYRQFGELTKNSHQIVNQLKQNNQCLNDMLKLIAGNLVNLRKQLEENNVSRDLNDQSETTLVEAIQNLTDHQINELEKKLSNKEEEIMTV